MVNHMLEPYISLNRKKLYENIEYYKEQGETQIIVVKSNGYGVGIKRLVKALLECKINHFAVFTLKEAKKIRNIDKQCFILLLNSIEKNDLTYCYRQNITISINSYEDYLMLKRNRYKGYAHLKLDTGMHRYGVNEEEFYKIIRDNTLNITGIFSHLVGGIDEYPYIKKQADLFDSVLDKIDTSKYLIHICSTNSCKIIKSKYQNAIRIGMGIFGLMNHLNPCISLHLPITLKRAIKRNEYCSYNLSFKAEKDGFLYVIPLGYHNLFLPNTKIKINGFINAGNICMNCLILYSEKNIEKKAITLSSYDLIKISLDNNYSLYYLLSSFTS